MLNWQQIQRTSDEMMARYTEAAIRVANVSQSILIWHDRGDVAPDSLMTLLRDALIDYRAARATLERNTANVLLAAKEL